VAPNTVVSKKDPVGQAISLKVNKQLSAIRKRKCNVIVTGLPEQVLSGEDSSTTDQKLFTSLREDI